MASKGHVKSPKKGKGPRGPSPSPLDELDHKLLAYLDKVPTATYKQMAELLNMSDAGVANRYKRPVFQAALDEIKKSTWDLILRAKRVSARRLLTLANDRDPNIALRAAQLLFGPTLQDSHTDPATVTDIIYRTRIGATGAIIAEREEINEAPKDTIELLSGDVT